MTDAPKPTFLPNLVGGVSIWKLARDLNEEKFFDKRLLVPETEGADSLPVTVRWKLEGLIPLREARARFPEDSAKAIEDFVTCLKKVAAEFDDPKSGYAQYKQAFTVPALDAEADNYFFDADTKKVCVINWGASPRSIGGREEFVFGYGSFDKLFAGAAAAGTAGAVAGAIAGASAPAAPAEAEKKPDEKKPEEKKKEDKKPGALLWGRPWWVWLLVLLAILLLLAALLFLLKDCNAPTDHADAGADAAAEAGVDAGADAAASDAGDDAGKEADAKDAGDDAGKEADAKDAGVDAGSDKDGGADAGKDGGKDAGGSKADGSGDGDGDGDVGPGGPGGIGIGGGGGKIGVVPGGPLVPIDKLPHRAHFHPDALRWKVASGEQFLAVGSPKTAEGQHFDVVLKPGNTFEQVTVLWQDCKGVWHQ